MKPVPKKYNPLVPLQNPIVIKDNKGKTVLWVMLGIATLGGIYYGNKWYNNYRLKKENKKVGSENDTNIASQIHSENRAGWTEGNIQLDLYRRIENYKDTVNSYKEVSEGKDMLEDTRKNVSSGTYQQILNIVGVKGGAIKPTSQTAQNVLNELLKYSWVVAKVDTRVRKSPKVSSAIFTTKPNILGTATQGNLIGLIDKQTLFENKKKLFYDDEHNTFFLPVIIFDKSNMNKYYKAFVAIANVSVYKDQPKGLDYFKIYSFQYNNTFSS